MTAVRAETEGMRSVADRREHLTWIPLGLWAGGAWAVLRVATLYATTYRSFGQATRDEAEVVANTAIAEFPSILVQGLIVGILVSLLAGRAAVDDARRPDETSGFATLAFLFSSVLVLSQLSGWPLSAPEQLARWRWELAPDDLGILSLFSLGSVAVVFVAARWLLEADPVGRRHGAQRFFLGRRAFALAVAGAIALPVSLAWMFGGAVLEWMPV